MLRAIVFDFDGVIANSEPLHLLAYKHALADSGVQLSEAEYYTRYLGYDDYGAFVAIAADRQIRWTGPEIQELIRRKAVRLAQLEQEGSVLFPGARDAIVNAAAAVPIAIASGALGAEIRRVLDRASLTHHFTAIVAAEDTPASKPSPEPYREAVARLAAAHGDVRAGECLAIEDSEWGLQSARSAGLKTLAVAQTYGPELLNSADLVIPTMLAFDLARLRQLFDHDS